jgi:hypothetical protein
MSHVRPWASFSALLVILSLSYPAHAAGSYAQAFDSNPAPGWAAAGDTWNATDGHYVNTNTAPFRAIAYFADRRWATDFTYSLRMNSDLGTTSSSHKVGVVFNFVDEMNYYEVSIDMLGNVELSQVSGGVRPSQPLETAHSDIPEKDVWFDVAIVRAGNKVKVRIGNQDVLAYDQLPGSPQGYIGVLSQFNWGRFDDVKVTPVIFRSGFGAGVSVTPPTCVGPAGAPASEKTYQLNVTGTESATGAVWPAAFWGSPATVLMNTILQCDKPFDNYLEATIKNDTAPYLTNSSNKVLSNTVKDVTTQANGNKPRLGLGYGPADVEGVPNRFYVRRYLRYSSALASPGTGKWFVQQEFKSSNCDIPRRLSLNMMTTTDPETGGVLPFYRLRMDQENNCGVPDAFEPVPDFPDKICYPTKGGPCPDFRALAGQWFYDEYFVKYSTGGSSSDRVAYAINGQVIFDYTVPVKTATPRGIKLTPGYLNIPNVEIRADDLEIYHDFPCRTFPCGAPSHY